MNFLVVGGVCHNIGSRLMLQGVAQAIRERFPESVIMISPMAGKASVLREMGYVLLNFPLLHVGSGFFVKYALPLMRMGSSKLPGNKITDISVVLDVSGFAFGDQFGLHPLRNLDRLTQCFRQQGSHYILLPQAFGPFSEPGMKQAMLDVIQHVDLVCARDTKSYSYLREIEPEEEKIRMFPDITLNVTPSKTDPFSDSDYCCIVPNVQMLRAGKGRDRWSSCYVAVLCQIAEHLHRVHQKKVVVLIHDQGHGDGKIARELLRKSSVPMELCAHSDPLALKSILAGSSLVVGSRFHALASALSSAVPAVALGWSHKYEEIFREHELSDCVFSSPGDFSTAVLDRVLEPAEYALRCRRLSEITERNSADIDVLWDKVAEMVHGE